MIKRIHGWSLLLGILLTLATTGIYSTWQKATPPHSLSSTEENSARSTCNSDEENKRKNKLNHDNNSNAKIPLHQSQSSNQSTSIESNNAGADFSTINFNNLPQEAQNVISTIKSRGHFPYRQDGQIFSNREGVLPTQTRGYYHEYTVPTPGADNRGARRIIAGSGTSGDVATGGEYYYTSDHYRTFNRVKE